MRRGERGRGDYLGGALCGGELVVWAAAELVDEFWAGDYKQPAVKHGDLENRAVKLEHRLIATVSYSGEGAWGSCARTFLYPSRNMPSKS